MKRILLDRTIGELMILMIAVTVCVSILAAGAAVTMTELIHPSADTSGIVNTLTRVLNTLIGVIAGFLAGRTDTAQQRRPREQDDESPHSHYR